MKEELSGKCLRESRLILKLSVLPQVRGRLRYKDIRFNKNMLKQIQRQLRNQLKKLKFVKGLGHMAERRNISLSNEDTPLKTVNKNSA